MFLPQTTSLPDSSVLWSFTIYGFLIALLVKIAKKITYKMLKTLCLKLPILKRWKKSKAAKCSIPHGTIDISANPAFSSQAGLLVISWAGSPLAIVHPSHATSESLNPSPSDQIRSIAIVQSPPKHQADICVPPTNSSRFDDRGNCSRGDTGSSGYPITVHHVDTSDQSTGGSVSEYHPNDHNSE